MKQGWEIKKLGEVCSVAAGQGAPQGDANYCLDGIPFIKAGNLEDLVNGLPELEIQKVSDEVAKQHRLKIYKAGSVVFAKSGMSCMKGHVYSLRADCYVVSHLAILTPHGISTAFLKYILTFHRPNTLVKDCAYPSISLEDIKAFPIPVPSRNEQEKIVAELDCLSGIIEKKKQQLKELDNLAQSIFYEMFGDPDNSRFPKLPLQNLSEYKLSYGSGASAVEFDEDVRYIRITDIQEDGKLDSNAMSPSVYEEKYLLHDGDILFARSGATVGKTYHYRNTDGKAIYAGYLIRFIPNQKLVLPEYVFYYTRSDYYHAFIRKSAQAVAQPNINAKQYGDLIVCVPPLALQQEFASKIEAIEKQKKLIKQSIQEAETLFNSRMDYYFN